MSAKDDAKRSLLDLKSEFGEMFSNGTSQLFGRTDTRLGRAEDFKDWLFMRNLFDAFDGQAKFVEPAWQSATKVSCDRMCLAMPPNEIVNVNVRLAVI